MIIQEILIVAADGSLVISAQNSLGLPVRVRINPEQLGVSGSSAVESLRQIAQGFLVPDPSPEVVAEIRELEERLKVLRQAAIVISPPLLV